MSWSQPTVARQRIAAAGVALALVSAAWIDPAERLTYDVFFAFAFAYSFVWLDSEVPMSVAHMATTTAFVYIAGFPILFVELMARCAAYPLIFVGARPVVSRRHRTCLGSSATTAASIKRAKPPSAFTRPPCRVSSSVNTSRPKRGSSRP